MGLVWWAIGGRVHTEMVICALLIERLNAFCFTSRHGGLGVWNDNGEEKSKEDY